MPALSGQKPHLAATCKTLAHTADAHDAHSEPLQNLSRLLSSQWPRCPHLCTQLPHSSSSHVLPCGHTFNSCCPINATGVVTCLHTKVQSPPASTSLRRSNACFEAQTTQCRLTATASSDCCCCDSLNHNSKQSLLQCCQGRQPAVRLLFNSPAALLQLLP